MAEGDGPTFEGHPTSLGEIRAGRALDASLWTPRECLVALLREIDEGRINPTELVVSWQETKAEGKMGFGHFVAAKTVLSGVGLLEMAKVEFLDYARATGK